MALSRIIVKQPPNDHGSMLEEMRPVMSFVAL